MAFPPLKSTSGALMLVLALAGCDQSATSPQTELAPQFARSDARGGPTASPFAGIVAFVDDVNAQFEASGQTIRLDYPWLFRVGPGTDPFMRLRTGSRWTTSQPGYILDESDFAPSELSNAAVEDAFVSAYDTWNAVPNSGLSVVRVPDPATNMDVLDGSYDPAGNCVFLYDLSSPNLDLANGLIFPETDIVVGGFPPATYFSQCLGSEDIIGVTWTFSDVDGNGDQYRDRLYVEQFYNPAFTWVTQGSQYLNFGSGVDLETIALHENGHAHGLGHFGGPLLRQPFTLKPDGRVFNPEAVMNPYYLYGEDRSPYPTDEAGLLTMYARGG